MIGGLFNGFGKLLPAEYLKVLQFLLGAVNDLLRESGELRDLDSVAVVSSALAYLVQKFQFIAALHRRNAEVAYSVVLLLH